MEKIQSFSYTKKTDQNKTYFKWINSKHSVLMTMLGIIVFLTKTYILAFSFSLSHTDI
jgi:hypothetical protein